MLFGSSFAAKDCGDASAGGGRNEDFEKLYQKRLILGATAIRDGRRFPRLESRAAGDPGEEDPHPDPLPRGEGIRG